MTRAAIAWFRTLAAPALLAALILGSATTGGAEEGEAQFVGPYPGTVSWPTSYGLRELVGRLQKSVAANGLSVVYTQSLPGDGKRVPRTTLLLVTSRDMAERMVAADPLAGIESPIRLWVMEGPEHSATLVYRTPTSILAIYDNGDLDTLAAELDQVFAKIVDDAVGG